MRFAHARPATVTLVAGSVLITATSGFSLAAVMGATSASAHPSSYAIAADDAATTAGDKSCQPLKATDPRDVLNEIRALLEQLTADEVAEVAAPHQRR